uniref:Protein kinase domain-containing protein n=2 Tax=Lotharella globosa TaxID=91324 RepID=A0A7S3YQF7_9EUKA
MAPEVMLFEQYSEKADIYSFAIVLQEMLTGLEPYSEEKSKEQLLMQIAKNKRRPAWSPAAIFLDGAVPAHCPPPTERMKIEPGSGIRLAAPPPPPASSSSSSSSSRKNNTTAASSLPTSSTSSSSPLPRSVWGKGRDAALRRAFPGGGDLSLSMINDYKRNILIDAAGKLGRRMNSSGDGYRAWAAMDSVAFTEKILSNKHKFAMNFLPRLRKIQYDLSKYKADAKDNMRDMMADRAPMGDFEANIAYWSHQKGTSKRSKLAGPGSDVRKENTWVIGAA